MSPFWQAWQPVGIRVGVSELKFAWSVGISVGKDVRVGERVERVGERVTPLDVGERVERVGERVVPVNVLSKRVCWRVGGRAGSTMGSIVGVLELYFVALAGTDVGKKLGKDAQVPPLSSDMRMLGPQSAQSVPRLQSE